MSSLWADHAGRGQRRDQLSTGKIKIGQGFERQFTNRKQKERFLMRNKHKIKQKWYTTSHPSDGQNHSVTSACVAEGLGRRGFLSRPMNRNTGPSPKGGQLGNMSQDEKANPFPFSGSTFRNLPNRLPHTRVRKDSGVRILVI